MEVTLYVTEKEAKLFQGLTPSLQEGWNVVSEGQLTEESGKELTMRYQLANFRSPHTKEFAEKVQEAVKNDSLDTALESFDMEGLPDEELFELFFVLGTKILSAMVVFLLQKAETDEDLEAIATLTTVRHLLSESNSEIASQYRS